MGFLLRVFSAAAEPFRVPIAAASATAEDAKEAIRDHGDGAAIGFMAATWLLFMASAAGGKEGGPLPLPYNHPFAPAAGSIVNVWVEPKLGAAAVPRPLAAGAGGGGDAAEYKRFARFLAWLRAEEEADTASAATPKEYEEEGRDQLVAALETNFGLRVVANARLHRLDKEIVAVLRGSTFDSEWDFRAPVLCSGLGPLSPGKSADLIIYPDQVAYIRPERPGRAKTLTPTKIGGAPAAPSCDFVAIFEITTAPDWTKDLVPCLEQRLAVSLDRARSLDESVAGILDVVAVVGVLGTHNCQRRIISHVTSARTPLLDEMMQAGRFVFVRKPFVGSPSAKSALGFSHLEGKSRGPKSPLGTSGGSSAGGGGGGGSAAAAAAAAAGPPPPAAATSAGGGHRGGRGGGRGGGAKK